MESENWKQISRIFDYVHTLSPDERTTLIKELCSDDPELEREILELLSLHETSAHYFEEHLKKNKNLFQNLVASFEDQKPGYDIYTGQTMGQWQLDELLGRGGMGTVYKAKRVSLTGVSQTGAFKIIHKSLATPGHVERFKLEQQILAKLNHPNIAAFIDSGITPDGIPYMVMEYVEGKNLLEYCDEKKLGIEQRLELFNFVCGAIQYAHNNLVVHRDLKPQNILVSPDGHIKILDFGIAKLLYPPHDEFAHIETRPGGRLMSLEYASPEQVSGDPITVSSDLYSLGVLLYTLLCGLHPFHFGGLSFKQIETAILETTPPAPSRRFETADAPEKITLAAARQLQPAGLFRHLKGDLDAIVLKSLRKEPKHRYESVSHLTDDIKRYQNTMPVQAREGYIRYRMVKFAKRNVAVLATAALFLFTITSAGGYHVYQMAEERKISQMEAAKNQQTTDFLMQLFNSSSPNYAPGQEITAKDLLETGAQKINLMQDQPELQADMMFTIGRLYREMGMHNESRFFLEQSLGRKLELYGGYHHLVIQNFNDLGVLFLETENFDEADHYFSEAYRRYQSINVTSDVRTAVYLNNAGLVQQKKGDYGPAKNTYQMALDILNFLNSKEAWLERASVLNNLGFVTEKEQNYEIASGYYLESLRLKKELFGEEHISVATTKNNLGRLYSLMGDLDSAIYFHYKTLEIREKLYSNEHQFIAQSLNNIAAVLVRMNRYEEAESYYTRALTMYKKTMGEYNQPVAMVLGNLGKLYKDSEKDLEIAQTYYEESIHMYTALLGSEHPLLFLRYKGLVDCLEKQAKYDEATVQLKKAMDIHQLHFSANNNEADSLRMHYHHLQKQAMLAQF